MKDSKIGTFSEWLHEERTKEKELHSKAEILADKVFDSYIQNKRTVNITINNYNIVFKLNIRDDGLALYYGEDELNVVLSISAYGIYNRHFARNEIIHILTHFFYLMMLNIDEYFLKLNGYRYKASIQQKRIFTPSREKIYVKDFNWSKLEK